MLSNYNITANFIIVQIKMISNSMPYSQLFRPISDLISMASEAKRTTIISDKNLQKMHLYQFITKKSLPNETKAINSIFTE